ncbi:uncharacterized protein MYCGRDRAFT_88611 [Zymoseptoria tritici IPO323]|uniref:Uncharacterized protein n=1 Tax=Zymoseptoria tritici (strain CBS 115943 / IPO323) TaxID=336722 RepID=F9WXD9_ZYMTI|nr:uncharacterized protein MYCGRDRAFT_88611 [Zymoseptoria tritici IPO323]EGP90817.1 hypothetical protein MYCGRDRAFT_88611 [Zymoseptoria tritici IPO323]
MTRELRGLRQTCSSNEPPRKRRVTNIRKSASASSSTNQPELQLPPQEDRILRTRIFPPKFNQRIEAPVVTELRQLCRMLICGTRMLIDAPRKLVTVDLDSIKTCKDLLVNSEPFDPSHGKILDNIWNVAKATSDRWNQALQDPAHIKKAHARCVHDWRPVVARLAAAVQGVGSHPENAVSGTPPSDEGSADEQESQAEAGAEEEEELSGSVESESMEDTDSEEDELAGDGSVSTTTGGPSYRPQGNLRPRGRRSFGRGG